MNYQGTIKTAFQRELRTVCFFFLCFCITAPKTNLMCSSAWARMKTFLPTGREVRKIINFTSQNRKTEFLARRHQNKESGNKKEGWKFCTHFSSHLATKNLQNVAFSSVSATPAPLTGTACVSTKLCCTQQQGGAEKWASDSGDLHSHIQQPTILVHSACLCRTSLWASLNLPPWSWAHCGR